MPKSVRYAYNQHGPFCVCALTRRPFSQRRGSMCVVRVSLDQAMRLFRLLCASRTRFAVDKATNDLPSGWCTCRCDQRQSRTTGRKRASAPPTAHSASTGQTPCVSKERPAFASTPRQDGSNLERGALSSSAGDAAAASIVSSSVCSPKHTSKVRARKPKLSLETVTLIKEMATNNHLWGAERIRGELLKLDIRVSKRTIQRYMKPAPRKRPSGQTWKTFLRNHMAEVWACDVRRFGAYEILPGRG